MARQDPTRGSGELGTAHVGTARAIDLTEALLLLSRTDQRSLPGNRSTCPSSPKEAAETLLALPERRGVTIRTSGVVALLDRQGRASRRTSSRGLVAGPSTSGIGSCGQAGGTRRPTKGSSNLDLKAVRAWAASKIELSNRGRVPASVIEQYKAAGN